MTPGLVVVPDARALARGGGGAWALQRPLAGGGTPRATYEVLATSALAAAVPWGAIDWHFGDERAVPPDHPESN